MIRSLVVIVFIPQLLWATPHRYLRCTATKPVRTQFADGQIKVGTEFFGSLRETQSLTFYELQGKDHLLKIYPNDIVDFSLGKKGVLIESHVVSNSNFHFKLASKASPLPVLIECSRR